MGGFVIGGLIAVALIAVAVVLGRALLRVPASETAATSDLVGALGTVVSTIPGDGPGEVTISRTDQWLRVLAHADSPIATGTTVVVVDAPSPTEVVVAESGF